MICGNANINIWSISRNYKYIIIKIISINFEPIEYSNRSAQKMDFIQQLLIFRLEFKIHQKYVCRTSVHKKSSQLVCQISLNLLNKQIKFAINVLL